MLQKKIFVSALLISLSTTSFAMFCPGSFNQINIGDTIAQVEAQCGQPSSQKSSTNADNQPQEWVYFLKEQPSDQATVKMTIAFDDKGSVTNMSVNGIGLTTTSLCSNNTAMVSVGATQSAVKTACGTPAYISQSNTPEAEAAVNKVVELTYAGTPNVVLVFQNGQLQSRK